ncbi:MAG: hypothetical protein AAGA08_19075 [Pseudomonadota bacterium]
MTEFGTLIADAWVSICGAFGALTVLLRLADLTAAPALARRFQTCLLVIIVLLTFRVGHWADLGWLFTKITYAAAALLPLTALLLAEGMMRLHAPKVAKQYCGWGAVIFAVLALLPTGWMEFVNVLGLLLFQLTGLGLVAMIVVGRDKTLLSNVENQGLNRMILSFLLILPFLATDFLSPVVPAIPVRLGGIAVLGLCLLTININRTSLSQSRIISSMAALCVVSMLLTTAVATLSGTDRFATVQIGVVVLSTIMLLATWQAARALVAEDRYMIMLREIADAKGSGEDAAIGIIQRGAGVSNTLALRETDLVDFDIIALRHLFLQMPVRTVATDEKDEQLAWFFKKYEATHAVCIAPKPLTVIALNNPSLMASDGNGYGLAALQRIAAQTVKQDVL